MDRREEVLKLFSLGIRNVLGQVVLTYEKIQEIRIRTNGPLMIRYDNQEFFISSKGEKLKESINAYYISKSEVKETMEYISNFSMYAFEEEMRQGFITVQGGHRIGITGKTILEGGRIKGMKYVSFINVRLSHQIKGCADVILPHVIKNSELCHTMIISPPGCGKTTLLRDIVRQVSNGTSLLRGLSVGVVDERSEIGACYLGVPQNDLGIRTDILDCCPKAEGIMMLIRSMSPNVLAVDEIGSISDIDALTYGMNCGCKLICTAHGKSIEEIRQKPLLNKLLEEKAFERFIILSNNQKIGGIVAVLDENQNDINR